MRIERARFYLPELDPWCRWFAGSLGLHEIARGRLDAQTAFALVGGDRVEFLLAAPLNGDSAIARYLDCHPPGVGAIDVAVPDLAAVLERRQVSGAMAVELARPPQTEANGALRWAQLRCWEGGLTLNLLERRGSQRVLPGGNAIAPPPLGGNFTHIDHAVLNVPRGTLEGTTRWFERALGFERRQRFEIATARSGLASQVLVHPDSGTQLPVNEPTSANSQIQEFLSANNGPGIQHIALATSELAIAVEALRARGVRFLDVPPSYYDQLAERLPEGILATLDREQIARSHILVDSAAEPHSVLLQIFTQPIFGTPTFFFELIERRARASGFGEGNFQALFEAIEREQLVRQLAEGDRATSTRSI